MSDLKKYYELQKRSNEEYRKFLKKLSNNTTSREFFSKNGGVLEPKRKKLHEGIVNTEYLSLYKAQSTPRVHFILGSIGSGKTSLKDQVITQKELKSFLYINFDDLKLKLPEYKILQDLNPKQAAQFVHSESSKLAGLLYKKSLQKKVNIIYEKNLRTDKHNNLHIVEEIKKAFKKRYIVALHVVFLDSYKEAWNRVQKRYNQIKRYVPKSEVKDTFQNLFPNLNKLLAADFKTKYPIKLWIWYNGQKSPIIDNELQKVNLTAFIFFNHTKTVDDIYEKLQNDTSFSLHKAGDRLTGLIKHRLDFLPSAAKNNLCQIDSIKKASYDNKKGEE